MKINEKIDIPEHEIEFSAIRSQGAGGQNVNKLATAIHLRFDIRSSSLPEKVKQNLLQMRDHRISKSGIIHIKAQQFRSQEQNREDALARLRELISRAAKAPKNRIPTKPTRAAKKRRLDNKMRRGKIKSLRQKVSQLD